MYLTDGFLQARVRQIADEARRQSNGAFQFEELIALPYCGAIILRFALAEESLSLERLDQYESMLYGMVGDEFLVDFMGSVYRRVGLQLERLDEILDALIGRFPETRWLPSRHAEGIRQDAGALLAQAGFDPDTPVWEIQADEEAIKVLIMGKENRLLHRQAGERPLQIAEVPAERCTALFHAACYAKQNRISLARILLDDL